MLILNIRTDLSQAMNVMRFARKNRSALLETAAKRYLKFLEERHLAGANWPPLSEETIKRKVRRQKQFGTAADPSSVLQETMFLVENLDMEKTKQGWNVGHTKNRVHPNVGRKGRLLTNKLIRIHTLGEGNVPPRKVIDKPTTTVRKEMTEDIRREYRRMIRRRSK